MQETVQTAPMQIHDPLVVIPCLNEAAHIARTLRQMQMQVARLGGRIVVVDGGSTDGTQRIVQSFVDASPQITLLHNPRRLQSAAVNLAVEQDNGAATHIIRVDAHSSYPDDFCDVLMRQAQSVYADSICVSMVAKGHGFVQWLNAATQNAPIGNGGSKHRNEPCGEYVEHGHHALIKADAFRAIGGYDETFACNEDAEFDYRLRKAGYRIWLTSQTEIQYHPRTRLPAIARQYYNYGAGRAKNLIKHSTLPKLRQTKVMLVLPAVLMAPLATFHSIFAIPALLWLTYCLGTGILMAWRAKKVSLGLCGPIAMMMHLTWSAGFWRRVIPAQLSPQRRLIHD